MQDEECHRSGLIDFRSNLIYGRIICGRTMATKGEWLIKLEDILDWNFNVVRYDESWWFYSAVYSGGIY